MWIVSQDTRVVKFYPITTKDGDTRFGRVKNPTVECKVQHSKGSGAPLTVVLRYKTGEWCVKYPDTTEPKMERSNGRMIPTGETRVVKGPVDTYPSVKSFVAAEQGRFGSETLTKIIEQLLAAKV